MKTLFVRLNSSHDPETVQYLLYDGKGGELLSEPPNSRSYQQLIAIVPMADVVMKNVTTPAKNKTQKRAVIPYSLEEELSEDLENLHFAYLDLKSQEVTTAIIAKQQLNAHLDTLETLGFKPDYIYAEGALLPQAQDNEWHIIEEDNYLILRSITEQFAFNKEIALKTILPTLNGEIIWYATHDTTFKRIKVPGRFELIETDILTFFAEHLDKKHSINLLQGFKLRQIPLMTRVRPYLASLSLVGVILLIFNVELFVDNHKLKKRTVDLHNQMVKLYQQTFPGATRARAPYDQMRSQVKRYQSKQTNQAFLYQLSLLEQSLEEIEIKRLAYQNQILTIRVIANDVEMIDALRERLASHFSIQTTKNQAVGDTLSITLALKLKQ